MSVLEGLKGVHAAEMFASTFPSFARLLPLCGVPCRAVSDLNLSDQEGVYQEIELRIRRLEPSLLLLRSRSEVPVKVGP